MPRTKQGQQRDPPKGEEGYEGRRASQASTTESRGGKRSQGQPSVHHREAEAAAAVDFIPPCLLFGESRHLFGYFHLSFEESRRRRRHSVTISELISPMR